VTVDVQVPQELDDQQRGAVEALAKVLEGDPRRAMYAATSERSANDG
jgi:hypothetical protein